VLNKSQMPMFMSAHPRGGDETNGQEKAPAGDSGKKTSNEDASQNHNDRRHRAASCAAALRENAATVGMPGRDGRRCIRK
jgi:hypothetical protein